MNITKFKHFIVSFRLRTLPLSLAGILLGSFYSIAAGHNRPAVFFMALITTLCLQILSNISNEVGDIEKGTDNDQRVGPIRSVQGGKLRKHDLKKAMLVFAVLASIFGVILVRMAYGRLMSPPAIGMMGLGVLAIIASVKYTFGKNAYGYMGFGDIFVFVFFGLVSTMGVYYVATGSFPLTLLLPASSVGMLSTGVLNVNNMRDIKNDSVCNKRTMAVRMGIKTVKIYHGFLIIGALVFTTIYTYLQQGGIVSYLFLLTVPIFYMHLVKVKKSTDRELDSQLKVLSLATLIFCILTGVGAIIK